MKLGLQLGYWGAQPDDDIAISKTAETLGYDFVQIAEAYGSDCFTRLSWIGAHTERIKLMTMTQLSARTPTCAAGSAMTLDHLSGGRVIISVGVSGPQVVEGWYGQPFPKPLQRTREWLDIYRQVTRRKEPLEFVGEQYQVPLTKEKGAMGLGKPLKSILHPLRDDIPVYLAAEGPKNVALATRSFDGWLPIWVSPYRFMDLYSDQCAALSDNFEIPMSLAVNINDDLDAALLGVKWMLALYIGGMGARNKNFYNDFAKKMGYEEAAVKIQDLYLDGKKQEAAAAVPDSLVDEISLVGPKERIAERFEAWKEASERNHVGTMLLGLQQPEALELMAELAF
mgnify:CR=1 FL=1